MAGEILSCEVRAELKHRHKKERDKRVADRIKAVLLRDDGWSYAAIAEALFLTEEGVRQQLKQYETSGKLTTENGGSNSFLSEAQTSQLLAHLDTHLYVKVSDICAWAQGVFGIRYSVRGMRDLITRHDFTFHQPHGVPAKANPEEQKAFIAEYESVMNSLGEHDQVVFMDGAHPTHAVRFVRGWIRRGVRKEIPTNGNQKRVNILGALNLEAMQVHTREYPTLNADNVLDFLMFLLARMPVGIVHVILDRGRYQHCAAIWAFAAQNPRLRLHYLPAYSPNLNSIERLWKIMHEHTTNNRYYATFRQFNEAILGFFEHTFPKNALAWTDRLTDNFRVVGAPRLAA